MLCSTKNDAHSNSELSPTYPHQQMTTLTAETSLLTQHSNASV